jgi:hypothetical protein
MRHRRTIHTTLALLCAALPQLGGAARARAQAATYVGVDAGLERGGTPARFPIHDASPGCGEFVSGSGTGIWLGARAELPALFSNRMGIMAHLGILQTNRAFTGDVDDPIWAFDPIAVADTLVARRYRCYATVRAATLDLMPSYRVIDGLSIALGTRVGYRFASRISMIDTLASAGDLVFDGSGRSRPIPDAQPLDVQPFLLDGAFAAWYRLPIARRFALIGELSGSASILSVMRQTTWRDFTARGSVGLVIALGDEGSATVDTLPAEPIPPITSPPRADRAAVAPADSMTKERPPAKSPLTASIAIYSINDHGKREEAATVVMIETEERRIVALEPVISFDGGDLPARQALLGSRADAANFIPDSLASLAPADVRRNLLNIVGYRMRALDTATIAIEVSGGDRSREGAGAARRYLEEIWGIDGARIAIVPASARAARQSARIVAGAPVAGEVIFTHTRRAFISPTLKLEPLYQSDTTIRRWTIVLDHHGTAIARYSSDDVNAARGNAYDWESVYRRLANDSTTLAATFSVEDMAGERVEARSEIPLRLRARRRASVRTMGRNGSADEIRYLFPEADSNATDLENGESETIDEIASSVKGRGSVEVIARAPRTGDALASRLATTIAAALARRGMNGEKMVHVGPAQEIKGHGGPGIEGPEPAVIVIVRTRK